MDTEHHSGNQKYLEVMKFQSRVLFNNFVVVLVWTVTSFLCHYFAKSYLSTPTVSLQASTQQLWTGTWRAVFLTTAQIALCYITVAVNYQTGSNHARTARVTHFLATLFTNLSLSFMFASSTLAIKLAEPVTTAIIQYFVYEKPLSLVTALSLPVIVGGAIMFSGNPLSDVNLSLGVATAFLSNIILAFRNTAIKNMETGDQSALTFKVQKSKLFLTILLLVTGSVMLDYHQGFHYVLYTTTACLLSSGFHVTYSYISTNLVLSQMSVVSHAVVNILKRVLVVLLLCLVGRRVVNLYNILGLVVCTTGLFIYALDKQSAFSGKGRSRNLVWICLLGPSCLVLVISNRTLIFSCGPSFLHNPETFPEVSFNSRVLKSDSIYSHSFGANSFKRPQILDLEPNLEEYLSKESINITKFLRNQLIEDPPSANYLSQELRTSLEVIKEAQRIHYNMFQDILSQYKYCMLLDIADFENKGDPAITVGEIYFLARINLEIIYYCSSEECTPNQLRKARVKANSYTPQELIILIHGGGSLMSYKDRDEMRFQIFEEFKGFNLFIFPQSIWERNISSNHSQQCQQLYCCNKNLTIVLRDQASYSSAKKHFNGTTRLLMAPDMAFHIGPIKRFVSPVFDILWIKREDQEATRYENFPTQPPDLRVHVADWQNFQTPKANSTLEKAFYATVMGLFFVQRARVVVTDRLHGHIFSVLLNIPHVLLDNHIHKLSAYHKTWTRSLANTRITDNPEEAMKLILELLKTYETELPPRVRLLTLGTQFGLD